MKITLEQLIHENYEHALTINRDDIPEEWVDGAAALMEVTDYGAEHHLLGHTYLARTEEKYVGIIMIGEALAWETDPDEMKGKPFYRVMGFVVDKEYRNRGIGSEILENAISQVYEEFGERSLALGVHKDNPRAGRFYERHGFRQTGVWEGNDEYYLRLILTREKVPFYCSAWSNIRSVRNAVKSGFIPAWVEMTVKPVSIVEDMNKTDEEKNNV